MRARWAHRAVARAAREGLAHVLLQVRGERVCDARRQPVARHKRVRERRRVVAGADLDRVRQPLADVHSRDQDDRRLAAAAEQRGGRSCGKRRRGGRRGGGQSARARAPSAAGWRAGPACSRRARLAASCARLSAVACPWRTQLEPVFRYPRHARMPQLATAAMMAATPALRVGKGAGLVGRGAPRCAASGVRCGARLSWRPRRRAALRSAA